MWVHMYFVQPGTSACKHDHNFNQNYYYVRKLLTKRMRPRRNDTRNLLTDDAAPVASKPEQQPKTKVWHWPLELRVRHVRDRLELPFKKVPHQMIRYLSINRRRAIYRPIITISDAWLTSNRA